MTLESRNVMSVGGDMHARYNNRGEILQSSSTAVTTSLERAGM